MPFMKGSAPVRRTKAYLEAGKLIFHPRIRVMTINYNLDQKASDGVYNFLFWHLPQIKYKNRHLQLLKFKNMTPTPCIQLFFADRETQVIDVYGRTRNEIHEHLFETFCEPLKTQSKEKWNPANFGYGCRHWCMCEVPGQVPCPGFVPLPKEMTGKYIRQKALEEQES
ncbi:probable 28S ribosomal protein S25, mitochondrial [Mercenaria mercenaria]|uniref:probable 28S ribosomal protein S25, mitochondrial n=1 Tax=Mercenaria mercenaria TaxID=6596 RepID=UPI00234E9BF4|nr:probable 28S ribosomal protein S25, mitochondrial [Mercenaria mercenaria]